MKSGLWVVEICIPEETSPVEWSQILSLSVQQPDRIRNRDINLSHI
jgi:hypothetical protein